MALHLLRLTFLALFSIFFTFLQTQINGPVSHPTQVSAELKRMYGGVKGNDPMSRYFQMAGNKILVEISMKGDIQATRTELGKMGFRELGAYGRLISGLIPVSSLPQLE